MTEITTNVASTIKSTDYNTTKPGEEKPQAKQMVSIFSSYDNNQDNSVSYAQDSSTKSYMDAQKKSIDSMLSGLTQSVKDKIKVSPKQLRKKQRRQQKPLKQERQRKLLMRKHLLNLRIAMTGLIKHLMI